MGRDGKRDVGLRRTKVGVALFLLVIAIALFGPLVAPYSPTEFVGAVRAAGQHAKLGTDYLGHDVLSRVLYGGRTVLALSSPRPSSAWGLGTLSA